MISEGPVSWGTIPLEAITWRHQSRLPTSRTVGSSGTCAVPGAAPPRQYRGDISTAGLKAVFTIVFSNVVPYSRIQLHFTIGAIDHEFPQSEPGSVFRIVVLSTKYEVLSRIQPEPRQILAPCGKPYRTRGVNTKPCIFPRSRLRFIQKAGSNDSWLRCHACHSATTTKLRWSGAQHRDQ